MHLFIRWIVGPNGLGLILGGLLSGAVLLAAPDTGPSTALPAPTWQLPDLAGQTVSSEQFKGKVVVVDFGRRGARHVWLKFLAILPSKKNMPRKAW